MRLFRPLTMIVAALALGSCAVSVPLGKPPPVLPVLKPLPTEADSNEPFVIAANSLAARAGLEILRRGGSAVDATIAIQAMLSLVEPQSSGVGGGAFMNYFDAGRRKLTIYDGREVAPAQASADMFLGPDGKPLSFGTAVMSGRATGVPGAVKMLAAAHQAHGSLPWADLFGDAQRTASEGFIVSTRLARMVNSDWGINKAPDVVTYFSKPDGTRVQAGDRLRNPAYAAFLGRLAAQGPDALYKGSTAAKIVERTRAAPLGGSMNMADLANYEPALRQPICAPYRLYQACVPPPPSSGVGLLQLLGLLQLTDIDDRGPNDPQSWFLFAEASRLMYADRDQYVGDPAFVRVPVSGLLDPGYIRQRAQMIGVEAGPPPQAGQPAGAVVAGADRTLEPAGTSHFIVRDAAGNVVSMTTTVESVFGSGRMVDGFFLNNQMTDFSFAPRDASGRPAANAVAPGKRPRSSMVPTILIQPDGRFGGAIGSAGGNSILAFVAKSLVAAVDWRQPMQQAIALPNLVARGSNLQGEVTKFSPEILAALRARGIDLKPGQGEDSGVHGVLIRGGRVDGGFDPRREGVVLTLPAAR